MNTAMRHQKINQLNNYFRVMNESLIAMNGYGVNQPGGNGPINFKGTICKSIIDGHNQIIDLINYEEEELCHKKCRC